MFKTILRMPSNGDGQTAELRAVMQAALLADIQVVTVAADNLGLHAGALKSAAALPVGDVGYLLSAMEAAGIEPPKPVSYPKALAPWMRREVREVFASQIWDSAEPVFVKPQAVKAFTGFVWRGPEAALYGEHDAEQLRRLVRFRERDPRARLWVSPVVEFVCEWRFYIVNGGIIGSARYDPDGPDDAPAPDLFAVQDAISACSAWASVCADNEPMPAGCALDFGVLKDGSTALVEANDGWALGLYAKSISPRQYLELLSARWCQLARLQNLDYHQQ